MIVKMIMFVLLAAWMALTAAVPVEKEHQGSSPSPENELADKIQQISRLLEHLHQQTAYPDHWQINETFTIDPENYKKPECAIKFKQLYRRGMLQRGIIFSVFHEEHLIQAKALYELLYYAKTDDIFYKTAVWARINLNEGLFLYGFSVALIQSNYLEKIPTPINEILPNYFYDSLVIQEAQRWKQLRLQNSTIFKVAANYSGAYLNLNRDQSLDYYLEDVRLNAYYYYYNLYFPWWLSRKGFADRFQRRGEQYYYLYQQLLARYYLERLSNGLGEIEYFNWELPFATGYKSSLKYSNGLEFPSRPNYARLYEYFYNYGQRWTEKGKYGYSYTLVTDYERRIRDLIDRGYVFTRPGGEMLRLNSSSAINILGNLIECNADSPDRRFYGPIEIYARHLLGYSYQPLNKEKLAPSVLEHFETSLRDPAFYQFYKRLLLQFQNWKQYLPSYTRDDLIFPGVEIRNIEVDNLETFFEPYEADITNAIYVTSEEFVNGGFGVLVNQNRLSYKQYNYRIFVDSANATRASVRVYLGPKNDVYGRKISLNENRLNFAQIDYFTYDLKQGSNVIERGCKQNINLNNLQQEAQRVIQAQYAESYQGNEQPFGCYFALPKGTPDGQEFLLYFIISPFTGSPDGSQITESYALGYPFDRHIREQYYEVPNARFYETKIYFKGYESA